MRLRGTPLIALAAVLTAPALADEPESTDLALKRLRACATAGASQVPRESLAAAVIAVRSLCRPQINTAYRASDRQVTLAHRDASRDGLAAHKRRARRAIDYNLALLVSTQTGLTQ